MPVSLTLLPNGLAYLDHDVYRRERETSHTLVIRSVKLVEPITALIFAEGGHAGEASARVLRVLFGKWRQCAH
jgi:hypothetical protein